jgi:hypothetical protein
MKLSCRKTSYYANCPKFGGIPLTARVSWSAYTLTPTHLIK